MKKMALQELERQQKAHIEYGRKKKMSCKKQVDNMVKSNEMHGCTKVLHRTYRERRVVQ